MATNTTNFDLVKPAGSDNYDIDSFHNGSMDKIDSALQGLGTGLAIISKNNTHGAISSGEYVYVHGHGSLAEGLYKANTNIAANGTLTSSNLTAVSGGLGKDVASLSNQIATKNIDSHLSKQSGASSVTDFSKSARMSANTINFSCDFKFTGRYGTVAVFDSGYRPQITNYLTCAYLKGGYQYPAYAAVQTNGEIFILLPESISADYVYVGGTFII